MATEALKKLAEDLKVLRAAKEISLQQIAGKTRIDIKFLTAIENADFDIMPEIYMRAFIKEYCLIIDLNPKEILKRYDEAKNLKQGQSIPERVVEPVVDDKTKNEPLIKKYTEQEETKSLPNESPVKAVIKNGLLPLNIIIGGVVLLVAVVVFYFAFISNSSPEIIKESSEKENMNNSSQRFETEQKPAGKSDSPVVQNRQDDSLRLKITTSAKVWVKVSSDGKIVQQSYVEANSKMNFSSKKNFSVSVGNAGAVKLFYNNKPIENIGKAGEMKNVYITPEAVRLYTIKPKPSNEGPTKKN